MNNLRIFQTAADYSAATLSYPAVSWVVSGDTVHYDNAAPTPTVNGTVTICQGDSGNYSFTFYNCGASTPLQSISAITFNNVAVSPLTCQTESHVGGDCTAVYALKGTTVGEEFSGDLGFSESSQQTDLEMMLSSEITSVEHLPNNVFNLVILATTPPSVPSAWIGSNFPEIGNGVYVLDSLVSAYQSSDWSNEGGITILPLSQYSGSLPIPN